METGMVLSKKSQRSPDITNPDGEIIQEILGAKTGGVQSHSLAEVTIPPGKSSTPHFHKQSEESYLILSGKATLVIDQETFELFSGDACLIQPQEVHQIANHSDEDLIFIAVCVPAWQPYDSFNITEAGAR